MPFQKIFIVSLDTKSLIKKLNPLRKVLDCGFESVGWNLLFEYNLYNACLYPAFHKISH